MKSDRVRLYVTLMLILQAASTAALWVLNVLSVNSTAAFEVLLAANLVVFAVVIQVYRNPDSITMMSEQPAPTAVTQPSVPGAAPGTEQHTEPKRTIGPALPPFIHMAIPVLAVLVLLLFAVVTFQPADKTVFPITSTLIFVPIYLVIVVLLVFGSMYLFKRLMDTEPADESH